MLKNAQKDFIQRHIGPSEEEQNIMLQELGFKNLDELIKNTVPEKILFKDDLGGFKIRLVFVGRKQSTRLTSPKVGVDCRIIDKFGVGPRFNYCTIIEHNQAI